MSWLENLGCQSERNCNSHHGGSTSSCKKWKVCVSWNLWLGGGEVDIRQVPSASALRQKNRRRKNLFTSSLDWAEGEGRIRRPKMTCNVKLLVVLRCYCFCVNMRLSCLSQNELKWVKVSCQAEQWRQNIGSASCTGGMSCSLKGLRRESSKWLWTMVHLSK